MTNYRQQLETLRNNLMTEVRTIRDGLKDPIVFLSAEQIENYEFEEYLDARNDTTGETYEIVLISISKDSIEVLEVKDGTRKEIGLLDLASINDMVSLYEMLMTVLSLSGGIK